MTKRGAKKRLPERPCPRGAKDNSLFRERLDAGALGRLGRSSAVVVFEAYRRHPCQPYGFVVRRRAAGSSRADPSTWIVQALIRRLRSEQTPVLPTDRSVR
jgi:hypothetical protein